MIGLLALALAQAAGVDGGATAPEILTYRIVNEYPHAEDAFTQGLFIEDGVLYESTGEYGRSKLRRLALESGAAQAATALPKGVFGEGATSLGDAIVVLTWREGTGFVFDRETLQQTAQFTYDGEGWGLTDNGDALIMSDGTDALRFLDPDTFEERRRVKVTFRGEPLARLNELEWIDGAVYANVWRSNAIVRIDPESGVVTGLVDMRGLLKEADITPGLTDVLNGIAYDEETRRLFVTGKNWPKLFEIELTPHPDAP